MGEFPLALTDLLGHWEAYGVFLIIGIAFGIVLELSGFANSKMLAAQFYFKDMTVFKVMFTSILVATVLIFLTTSLGWLDYNLIFVPPTYLWPGIVGGLVMGVGFIIGGFCPGTSLVAAGTGKIDGIVFVLGVFFGIFLFGETVGEYESFWYSSDYGRYTLQDWLGLDAGVVVLGIVILAILAFWGSEYLEQVFGNKPMSEAPQWRYYAAGGLVLVAAAVMLIGQPDTERRWSWIEEERTAQLENREVQIHPGEFLALSTDKKIRVVVLDVRDEADYNIFHLNQARHVPMDELENVIPELRLEPPNTVFFVVSNDETRATKAWKTLVAESVPNAYILEGGINNWLNIFADEEFKTANYIPEHADDKLAYAFGFAIGDRHPAAHPSHDVFELEYEEKVKLETNRAASSGGCG